jgi:MFS family permease
MTTAARHRFHYAWIILVAACVLGIVARADSASFAVFIDPLVERFGWKRGDISFAYALAFLAGMPAVVVMGWLGDRFGARVLMIGASLLISGGTYLMGTIKELWQFYVLYGLFVGSMGHAAFTVLLPVIVTRWFHKHMGLALGIYWAALGAGPMIFAPLFRWLIDTRGWEQTFTIVGAGLGVVLLAFSMLIHSNPRDKGLLPYGAKGPSGEPARAAAVAPSAGIMDILGQRPMWLLVAVHHLGCAGHAVILAHIVSMATFRGLSGIEAAGVLSAIAGVSIFSRFGFSILTERLGGRTVLAMAVLGQSGSVLILLFANEAWMFYLFALFFGICYGGEMVGFPIINRHLFGEKAPLSSIYAFQTVGAGTGMALGGWLGGALFDATGSYNVAIIVSAVVSCAGLPLALCLPRHRKSTVTVAKAAGVA